MLIRRHDKYLYRVIRSVLTDNEAEDVIQETFMRAFRRLGDFRGDASLLNPSNPAPPGLLGASLDVGLPSCSS